MLETEKFAEPEQLYFIDGVSVHIDLVDTKGFAECRFFVVKDEAGVFCAKAENLPGVFTYGESLEEVDANMREAFELAIETHVAEGERVPWQEIHDPLPPGSIRRRVLVHVEAERDKVS